MNISSYMAEEITLRGTPEEIEALQAMLAGTAWISRGDDGKLVSRERFKALPPPEDDPKIPVAWTEPDSRLAPTPDIRDLDPSEGWHSPSYLIQHLCGYRHTVENYRKQALKLQSYGFECLRSRRDRRGQYWEIWFLPGVFSAEGDLRSAVLGWREERLRVSPARGIPWNEESEFVARWLCRHVEFGSLDTVVQRAAMAAPE